MIVVVASTGIGLNEISCLSDYNYTLILKK